MKSIRECEPAERYARVLLLIDAFCAEHETQDKDCPFGTLYKLAHAGLGHCRNPHDDWIDEIDKMQEDANRCQMVNTDEHIAEYGVAPKVHQAEETK